MRFFLFFLLLTACSPLTEREQEEKAYNDEIDRQNWELCQEIYKKAGVATYSRHAHKGRHRSHEVRDDLFLNNCRKVLGPYWADRI